MKLFIKNTKNSAGFTLIEMIMYIAILAIVSVLVINVLFVMIRAFTDIRVARDINNVAVVALDRIVREIRTANSVDVANSIFSSTPGKLVLNTKDSLGNNTSLDFFVDGGIIKVIGTGTGSSPLHTPSVVVNSLIYNLISGSNSSAIRIELVLVGKRGNVEKTSKFYSTVVLRGSY